MFQNLFGKTFEYALAGMVIITLLSCATFFSTEWFSALCIIILLATLVLGLKNPLFVLLILVAELFAGSQGRLFSVSFSGFSLSLRMGIFLAAALVWCYWFLRTRKTNIFRDPLGWWGVGWVAMILLGIVLGIWHRNNPTFLYFDVNGLFMICIAPFCIDFIRSREHVQRIVQILVAAIVYSALCTTFLLIAFSHDSSVSSEIYRWVRDTRMYEITGIGNNFYRIFSQSQIFSLLGIFLFTVLLFSRVSRLVKRQSLICLCISLYVLLMSFSRSFWVGFLVVAFILCIHYLRRRTISWRKAAASIALFSAMIVCEIAMISFIANFPRLYGKDRGPSALTIFQERTTDVAEIAARSRYALFLPLLRAGVQRPLLGSGYGSTVTFTSYEPRITGKSESATYTTFAFEWGYLDLFYKSGLLGLVIVIGFLLSLLLESFPRQSTRGDESEIIVNQWIFFAICALAITHIFSPYLNHPIGIGFVVLSASCLFVLRRTRRIEINS